MLEEHYATLRRGTPRTYVVLAEAFLARFPHHADFFEGLTAQHKLNPVGAAARRPGAGRRVSTPA